MEQEQVNAATELKYLIKAQVAEYESKHVSNGLRKQKT